MVFMENSLTASTTLRTMLKDEKTKNFTESLRTWYLATGFNTTTVASCDLLDDYAITLNTGPCKPRCRCEQPKTLSEKVLVTSLCFVHTQEQDR